MDTETTRRLFLRITSVLSAGITGCLRLDSSSDERSTETASHSTTARSTVTTDNANNEEITIDYTFSRGESYTYEVSSSISDDITEVTWEVTSIRDGNVTVKVTTNSSATAEPKTEITAAQDEIFQRALDSEKSFRLPLLLARVPVAVSAGKDLSQGNSWIVSLNEINLDLRNEGSTATPREIGINVTGTDSVMGVECTTIELTNLMTAKTATTEACVAPEYPFALWVRTSAGDSSYTVELVSTNQLDSTATPTEDQTPKETATPTGSTIIDDFENKDQFEWSIDSGDRSRLQFTTDSVKGSNALYFKRDDKDTRTEISRSLEQGQFSRFSFWYKYRSENNNNFTLFLRNSSGNNVVVFQEANESTRYWNPNKKGSNIQNSEIAPARQGTWYNVVADNINFPDHTMNIFVYRTDGQLVSSVQNAGFWNTSDKISEIVIRNALGNNGNPDPLWIDHITYKF